MDVVVGIFTQLGADSSVAIQFFAVLLIFFSTKFLFFGKLQLILDTREEKTTKQEESADKTFEEADKVAELYKSKIEGAYQEAQTILDCKKKELEDLEKASIKETEIEVTSFINEARSKNEGFISEKKAQIFKETESLASQLAGKLTH